MYLEPLREFSDLKELLLSQSSPSSCSELVERWYCYFKALSLPFSVCQHPSYHMPQQINVPRTQNECCEVRGKLHGFSIELNAFQFCVKDDSMYRSMSLDYSSTGRESEKWLTVELRCKVPKFRRGWHENSQPQTKATSTAESRESTLNNDQTSTVIRCLNHKN